MQQNQKSYSLIHFVTSGRGHYYINDNHHIVEEGQCFFTPENTSVFYHADTKDPWNYSWICFKSTDVENLLQDSGLNKLTPVLSLNKIPEIQYIVFELLNHYEITRENEWFIQSYLLRIFGLIQLNCKKEINKIDMIENPLLIKAISFCRTCPLNEVTVLKICEHLHISRTYLFLLFKNDLNISPQQFITNSKISHSRELLAKTTLTIEEIAYTSGYKNQFAFSRAFKREISLTPSAYRLLYLHPSKLLDR